MTTHRTNGDVDALDQFRDRHTALRRACELAVRQLAHDAPANAQKTLRVALIKDRET